MQAMKNTATAKIAVGVTALVMVVSGFAAFATTASAATDVATLCALAKQLNISTPEFDALCATEGTVTTTGTAGYVHHPSIDYSFNQNLYLGSRGNDVLMLQKVLNLDGATQVATSGAGSPGNETSYFGPATRAAVIKFQAKWGISPAAGYFYPLTRAEMNKKSTVVVVVDEDDEDNDVTGDVLEVEEGDRPDSMEVGANQKHVPSTVVELTTGDEDVTIKTITVEVTGAGRKDVDSVSVWYDGKVVDTDSVNSDNEADLKMSMSIDDGETVELMFAANMESTLTKDGLTFKLEVVEIETDGADVDGLPVDGARHEINNSVVLNTFTLTGDMEDGKDVRVGDDEVLIATIKIENDNANNDDEAMFVQMLTLEQVGTIGKNDIDNVFVTVDGDDYDADMDGDYYTFDFGNGIEIPDGDDMEFEIYADILNGAAKTIDFAIDADDAVDMIMVVDEDDRVLTENTGANVTIDSSITIQTGNGDASKSSDITDGNIAVGEDDAEFASFDLDVEGEDMTGDVTIRFTVATTSVVAIADAELDDITIRDEDGNEIASADDVTITASGNTFLLVADFDDITFEEGDMAYIITGDVDDDIADGTTYQVTAVEFASFEGDESDETITIASIAPMTTQTVQGAALAMGVDDSIENDEVRGDDEGVELAVVQLDAVDSGEDIEVQTVSLTFALNDDDSGGEITFADIDNCVLVDSEGEEVSDELDLTALTSQDFDMDSNFMVERGTVRSLSLQCDLSDDFEVNDTITVTVVVADSEAEADVAGDVTPTAIASGNTGVAVTIVTASITATVDEDPEFQSVRTGTTVDLGSIELDNVSVSGKLDRLPLSMTGRTLLNSNRKVSIKEDGVVVAYAYFTTANIVVDTWVNGGVTLTKDEPTYLSFEAALTSSVATQGGDIAINIDGQFDARVDGDDYDVATTTATVTDVYSGLPTIVLDDITTQDLSDNVVMKFSIAAVGEDIVLAATTSVSVVVTGSATTTIITPLIYGDTSSYSKAKSSGVALTAGNVTIKKGDTYYFVAKGNPVSEGANGDIIQTTVDLDEALFVKTLVTANVIDVVEGEDVNSSEELVYKHTN